MPGPMVTQADAQLFFRAACCLISADGKVRGEEITVLSNAMSNLGFPHTADQVRNFAISTCKDLHSKGVDSESKAIATSMLRFRGTDIASFFQQVLDSMAASDGSVAERERLIASRFREALLATGRPVSPQEHPSAALPAPSPAEARVTMQPAKPLPSPNKQLIDEEQIRAAARIVAAFAPLLFVIAFFWWLLAPSLVPSWYYALPKISVTGDRANWVTFSDWEMGMFANSLEAVVAFHPTNAPTLFPTTRVSYTFFDKSGVKLGGHDLSVPKIGPGEKAKVKFYIDKHARRLNIVVTSL